MVNYFFRPLFFMLLFSCTSSVKQAKRPSFRHISGINFTEVSRKFSNGLSFDSIGFQQEPEWKLNFISNDSVLMHNLKSKKILHYPIHYDHDSVCYFGREWFRVKLIAADSLILQRLQVESKEIIKKTSDVFMLFYSDAYLNKLQQHADELKKPGRNDTLFIQALAGRANRNPGNLDSSFAARNPVEFQSKSGDLIVHKQNVAEGQLNTSASYSYLYPAYAILIKNAYKDFYHSYSVLVDSAGTMRFGKFLVLVSPEFQESRRKVEEGITQVYLQRFLKIKPGSTLGIKHTSEVMLYVKGTKSR